MTVLPRMDPGEFDRPGLVGRAHELAVARDLLTRPDLQVVTIWGPGGVGKTRLAQAVLADMFASFDLGGCFVDLAPLRGEGQLLPALVHALHLSPSPKAALDHLAAAIGSRSILLVLDNLEHLPTPECDLACLVARLPGARFLVTSRHVVRLRGVQELPLRPLALPHGPADAAASPAVQLFVQRAQAVDPEFALTPENAPVIRAICTVLDGLPLALELAAARLRAVDLSGLLGWLERPLAVLTGGPVDDTPRRQSLRSAVRWSTELLTPEEREVFLACGVFLGGFTLDALETVAYTEEARTMLIRLVEHSLVQRAAGPEPRWRLLEPVRECALEDARTTGRAGPLADRHARYYLTLAEHLALTDYDLTPDAMARLLADQANLDAALEHVLSKRAAEDAQKFVQTLSHFWSRQGGLTRVIDICRRVLALPEADPTPRRAEVLQGSAWLAIRNHQAAQAVAWSREALETWRALGDPAGKASALSTLADVLSHQGQTAESITCFEEALSLARAQNDLPLQMQTHHNLGITLGQAGRYADALTHLGHALDISRQAEHPFVGAYASVASARMGALLGELAVGLEHLRRAWDLSRDLDDHFLKENLLHSAALLSQRRGHQPLAVRLAAASTAVQTRTGVRLPPWCEKERDALIEDLRAALPEADFAAAWTAGTHAGPEEVAAEMQVALQGQGAAAPLPAHLTPRELQVLLRVAQGGTDKKIARDLGISAGTVGKHVASLLSKLEVHNRVELARWALTHDLSP